MPADTLTRLGTSTDSPPRTATSIVPWPQSSGNEFLVRFIADVENWVKRFPNTTLSYPGRPETALQEHDEIIAAIQARDPVLAEQLARHHMGAAETLRMQMLFGDMPSRPDLG